MQMASNTKSEPGRPTKYLPEYDEQVKKLCLLGMTDLEISEFFEVDEKTLNNWKKKYRSFFQSMSDGREKADAEVTVSLYDRAKGFERVETDDGEGKQVKRYYPPDTTAAKFWLIYRRRLSAKPWCEKIETALSGSIDVKDTTDTELARTVAYLLNKQAQK